MKFFIFCILLFPFFPLSAQKNELSRYHLQVSAGRCFHGSGDLRGVIFSTNFSKYFKKRISWSTELSGTIHDGSFPLFFDYNGEQVDGSIRYTVAGVQLSGHIGYRIISKLQNELQIKMGVLCRYQSSSLTDDVSILYPPATNLQFPVVVFNNVGPLRTIAPGGSIQLHYNYTFNKKFTVGLLAGFQADTEGDNLFQTSLTAGIRL